MIRPVKLMAAGDKVFATFLLFALGAAACGGSGHPAALSKADYIKAGNAICAEADAKTEAIPGGQPTASDMGAWKSYLDKAIPITRDEAARLKAITPPSADKATIDSLLALVATLLVQAERARSAAAAGDTSSFGTALNALSSSSNKANQISIAYGLTVCGQTN